MTTEYKAYLKSRQISPPVWADDYIAHYGVKGQKWGVRNYQYSEGGYTPAGAERYWGGTGQGRRSGGAASAQRQRMRMGARSGPTGSRSAAAPSTNQRRQLTPEQRQARRARTRKVLAVGAGVAVAAALGYAAYRGSTNLRDNMRSDIYKNTNTDFSKVHTFNSKYWNADDRRRYSELSKERADFMAKDLTRRDAVAAKFAEKTGIRINLPQSRERTLAARRNENNYANFIRDAERRGSLNREISEARKALRNTQHLADRSRAMRSNIQNERYGEILDRQHQKTIEAQRERLNNLLLQRQRAS